MKLGIEQPIDRARIEPMPQMEAMVVTVMNVNQRIRLLESVFALGRLKLNRRIIREMTESLAKHVEAINMMVPANVACVRQPRIELS